MIRVPYRGTAQAATDLISGQVQLMFSGLPTAGQHVKTGKLRLLGAGSAKRSAALPDTPAIAETVPGFELVTWYGIFAPARTPQAIIERLNAEIAKVQSDAELREPLMSLGLELVSMTPRDFGRYTERYVDRWARVIKHIGLKVE
jgi:tripartite-type tricarboxylate transporter receptor subunit TctC